MYGLRRDRFYLSIYLYVIYWYRRYLQMTMGKVGEKVAIGYVEMGEISVATEAIQ